MILFILFFLPFLINFAETIFERKFQATLNPGLPPGKLISSDLIYISALGESDQLHYIWTTLGVPTVLIIRTNKEASINIDYDKLFNTSSYGAITFNGSVKNSFGVVFNKLFEFEDDKKSGNILNKTVYPFFLNNTLQYNSSIENTSQVVDELFSTGSLHPTIKIEMSVRNGEIRNKFLPHMQYTANSTQVELIVEGKAMSNKSRFAVEMFIYSNSSPNSNLSFNDHTSIDDEYTPGIFEISDLTTPSQSSDSNYVGYLQWKPLSYQSSERAVNDIIRLTTYPIIDAQPNETQSPIIQAFYGELLVDIMIKKTNFSFGAEGDDLYKDFNSWTVNIGLGIPAVDRISIQVITIIAVVMGLPTILFIASFTWLKMRKHISQPKIQSMYEQIR